MTAHEDITTPWPHHDDHGRGDPVALVHAFPLDARMWEPQVRALAQDARVITIDLRGFGRSADMAAPESLDAHADDLAAVLSARGVERATLCGLSMGGYVALAFARRHRARLARLVLADTRATPDAPEARANRDRGIEAVQRDGVGAFFEAMLPKLLAPGADPALRERVRALAASQPVHGVACALAAMRDRPDATPLLATIAVPTLVLVGEHDAVTPPDEARAMASAIPGARLAVLPGAGHLANLENPGAFDDALRAFLRETAAG